MGRANTIDIESSIFSAGGGMPSIVFERSGEVNNNNYLYAGRVITNKTGVPQGLLECETIQVWIRCQLSATFTITFYEHDGDNVGVTTLFSVTMTSSKSTDFDVNDFGVVNPTKGRQLSAKVTNGSCKNLRVYMINRGIFDF